MPGLDSTTKIVTDVTALRSVARLSKGVAYIVLSTGAIYKYDSTSSATDEGDQVVKPNKISGNGRFLRMQGDQEIEPGQKAINVYRLASNVADAETITIGADVYEFKTSGNPVAGHIKVDASGGVTPTLMSTALAAAINASATEKVTAVRVSANEILIISTNPGAITIACASTLAGANNAWAAANMYGGRAAGTRKESLQTRVPNATEVALATMHFEFDFTPSTVIVRVGPTATPGVVTAFDGTVTISSGHVTLVDGGAVHLATSQTVIVSAIA